MCDIFCHDMRDIIIFGDHSSTKSGSASYFINIAAGYFSKKLIFEIQLLTMLKGTLYLELIKT